MTEEPMKAFIVTTAPDDEVLVFADRLWFDEDAGTLKLFDGKAMVAVFLTGAWLSAREATAEDFEAEEVARTAEAARKQ